MPHALRAVLARHPRSGLALAAAFLLLVTLAVYLPGLSGNFIFDDFPNIVMNYQAHLSSLTPAAIGDNLSSGIATVYGRPLSMLTFGLNYYLGGLDPFYFKLTNILIHLINTLGVFVLARLLMKAHLEGKEQATGSMMKDFLPLAIAACWALHPLNVSTVLYIVQRMNQLAALFTILGACYYCHIRLRGIVSRWAALAAFATLLLLLALAMASKENGALLIPSILAIEYCFFRFKSRNASETVFLRAFYLLLLVLPLTAFLAYTAFHPGFILEGYTTREFSLIERLLTQSRAIWTYVQWILLPRISDYSFYHDTVQASRGLLSPISTLASLAALAALGVFLAVSRRRLPLLCFGISWFFAGHLLESTIFPLELVFEHRNYLPSFGLLFGAAGTLFTLPEKLFSPRAASVIFIPFLIFLIQGSWLHAQRWGNTQAQLADALRSAPESYRVNYSLGYFFLRAAAEGDEPALYEQSRFFYRRATQLNETAISGPVGEILSASQNGQNIPAALVRELEGRLLAQPLNNYMLHEITTLTRCYYSDTCQFDKSILLRVYNTIAQNEHIPNATKHGMLDVLGTTIFRVSGNLRDSAAILYMARGFSEKFSSTDLKLIEAEIQLDNLEQAADNIQSAMEKDPAEQYLDTLAGYQTMIDGLRN